MSDTSIPNTIEVIEKLRWNAHLNKHIHFNASKRDRRYHIMVGVPIVIITVLLSFFLAISGADRSEGYGNVSVPSALDNSRPLSLQAPVASAANLSDTLRQRQLPSWAEWVGEFLALFAAALSGIQTFFNFQKEYEGHRQIGNQYLSVARECDRLISLYFDNLLDLHDVAQKYEVLNNRYHDINSQAETFNVTDKDYERAKQFQEQKDAKEPSLVQRKRHGTV